MTSKSMWKIKASAEADSKELAIKKFEELIAELRDSEYEVQFAGGGGYENAACKDFNSYHRLVRKPQEPPLDLSEIARIRQLIAVQ